MNMRTKLTLAFLSVAVIVALVGYYTVSISERLLQAGIGEQSVVRTRELLVRIDASVYGRIEQLRAYDEQLAKQPALIASNRKFEELDDIQEYIAEQDRIWQAAGKDRITAFMADLIGSQLSRRLRDELEQKEFYRGQLGYELFSEVFVTNKYGANTAQTHKTTDYYQADETWWREAEKDGLHVADIEYDRSAGVYSTDICVRIDDKAGNFLGILKAVVNLEAVISSLKEADEAEPAEFTLLTADNKVIYATKGHPILEPLANGLPFNPPHRNAPVWMNYFITKGDIHRQDEGLYAFARSGGFRDYEGLGWQLAVKHDRKVILAPVAMLRDRALGILLAVTALAIISGVFIAGSVTNSLKKLTKAAVRIGQGDLSARVKTRSRDEVGQLTRVFNEMAANLQASTDDLEREVAERKRAEEDLRKEQEFTETALNSQQDTFFLFEPDTGKAIRWNQAFRDVTGYTDEEIAVMAAPSSYYSPEDIERANNSIPDLLETGTGTIELELICKDGHKVLTEYNVSVVKDEERKPKYIISIGRDISDRKRAEEALRKSEEQFRRFSVASSYGFAMGELGGQLIYANAATVRIVEEDSEESFTSKTFYEFYTPQDAKKLKEDILPTVLETGQWVGEIPLLSARGNLIATEQSIFLIRDEKGTPRMIGNIITDITDRKRAEAQRLSLERQVQYAQKLESLGLLAGGIAHDFNNILMVILGNADLAIDALSSHAPARDNIEEILKASKRAAELARQMLAYSGKGRFVVEPIDLGKLVDEMAHLLEVSISKKVVLKYNFADNLPAIDADATQIRQIIMNLITNASEAVGDKSGVVALSTGAIDCDRAYLDNINEILLAGLDEPLREGLYVYIEVADTGCGMDTKTMERIFDPFFTTKFTGRGLGMSAVLGIVRGHRGAIKISSKPGRGTTFKVLFPAGKSTPGSAAVKKHDTDKTGAWRGQGTVLIVDDEETVRAVGKQALGRMGFDVLTAADGREAIEVFKARADEIACVILDLTMPHMDGKQTFGELRRIRPEIKVILCSGYNEQDATRYFTGTGLAGFIQKPYDLLTLRKKLMEVLADDKA